MSLFQEVPRIRVIGHSDAIRRVEREALQAARGDASVLITGEPGVGKAVIARFVHEYSGRSPHGFAMINCDGLPDLLFESELFGHVQGSFTGAYRDKPGLLASVPGGTLFLEEVGALGASMHESGCCGSSETGTYLPVGWDRVKTQTRSPIQARPNVRLIASTTADLPARVAARTFLRGLA
jgi:DNA-binding NtrC family response regulator